MKFILFCKRRGLRPCRFLLLTRLDNDERSKFNLGHQGDTWCVNGPGLYSLMLGSGKPEAKTFKRPF